MGDEVLRRAERADDDEGAARALVERLRRGQVDEVRLRVAAHLGHEPARLALAGLELSPASGAGWPPWYEAFEHRLGTRAATALALVLGRLLAPFAEPSDVLAAAEAAWREPGGERAERARQASDAAEAAARARPPALWSDARGTLAATARGTAAWCAWAASTLRSDGGWQGVSGLPRLGVGAVEEAVRAHLTASMLPWATGERGEPASIDGSALRAELLTAVEAEITSGARDPGLQRQRAEAARLAVQEARLQRILDASPGRCPWRAAVSTDGSLFGIGVDDGRRMVVAVLVEGAYDALLDLRFEGHPDPTPMPAPTWRREAPLDGARLEVLREALTGCAIVVTEDVAQWRCGGAGSLVTVIGERGAPGPRFEVTSPWSLVETAANARFADLLLDAAEAAFSQEPRVLERIAALARHRQVEPSSLDDD